MTEAAMFLEASFSPLSRHFALFLRRLDPGASDELLLAAALVSEQAQHGHTCLDLTTVAERPLAEALGREDAAGFCPSLTLWQEVLGASSLIGRPGEQAPLILDSHHRLYLFRYWNYESKLAGIIRERSRHCELPPRGEDILRQGLSRLFPSARPGTDWQKVAAAVAVMRNFCVISGGPGTGKTSTVVKVLALLLEAFDGQELSIALAAPTGKAVARLKESIAGAKVTLSCTESIRSRIPEEVMTLHRLLGPRRFSSRFRFNAQHSLPYDVVVVDEASMIDLPLMGKLLEALKPSSRLILLGDKDQLASVEAGAVLGDLCTLAACSGYSSALRTVLERVASQTLPSAEAQTGSHLRDSVVFLEKSYRFDARSGIGRVCRLVNDGQGEQSLAVLQDETFSDVSWKESSGIEELQSHLRERVRQHYEPLFEASSPEEAFACLSRFIILCAVRNGPCGVNSLNARVEDILQRKAKIPFGQQWYAGKPILVTRNDERLGLYNGDVGVIFPDTEAGGELRAFFPAADGKMDAYLPSRLPPCEPVYAMTVHKSQGSEFDRVLFVLPEQFKAVLTRELVYTAISRARVEAEVWGPSAVYKQAVARRVQRQSGLADALQNEMTI